jgi:hypothetical protein
MGIVVPVLLATLVVRPLTATLLARRDAAERERTLFGRELRLVTDAPRDQVLLRATGRALREAAPRLFGGAEAVTASAELARYVRAEAARRGLVVEQTETETVLDGVPLTDPPVSPGQANAGRDTSAGPLRVALRAHGDVRAVVAFLQTMEDGPRLVRVERIGIGRGVAGGVPDRGALTFTATLAGLARNRFFAGSVAAAPIVPAAPGGEP